jgi:hypothetical protein
LAKICLSDTRYVSFFPHSEKSLIAKIAINHFAVFFHN